MVMSLTGVADQTILVNFTRPSGDRLALLSSDGRWLSVTKVDRAIDFVEDKFGGVIVLLKHSDGQKRLLLIDFSTTKKRELLRNKMVNYWVRL